MKKDKKEYCLTQEKVIEIINREREGVDKDIFDLDNLNDLDSEVRDLVRKKVENKTQQILSLFDMKERLSVLEIIVGLFRRYETKIKYQGLMTILGMLSQNKMINQHNKIKQISKGLYEKISS